MYPSRVADPVCSMTGLLGRAAGHLLATSLRLSTQCILALGRQQANVSLSSKHFIRILPVSAAPSQHSSILPRLPTNGLRC